MYANFTQAHKAVCMTAVCRVYDERWDLKKGERGTEMTDRVGSLAGGLTFQMSCLEPSGMVAVSDSSHFPSILGKSRVTWFFSMMPSTCTGNDDEHKLTTGRTTSIFALNK